MTQCCHLLHESANELVAGHSLGCWFFVWVCFWFVLLVFVCLFFWFAFACLSYGDDGFLDYVQVLHQFSFVALNSRWPRILICNYCFCNAIESVKRPGGSHEGVGRKKKELAQQQSRGQPGVRLNATYQYEAYAGFHVIELLMELRSCCLATRRPSLNSLRGTYVRLVI